MSIGLDEAQWIEYYEALEKPLFNVVYRWLWDAAESQDVVQDAFLKCWKIRQRIRADGFKPLVFRTALRLASNRRRRKKLWRMVSFGEADELSALPVEPLLRSTRDAIDGLPEPLKRVLLLSELAGMSYAEIAAVIGIKEGTVGSRRNRALTMLRTRLARRGIDCNES
ncbi:MAG TPA: sigma-70 family RNA polymerase sigma factor [Gammaproteobacteria bacterium]|nr:sigma-70 family RNA polymerase sigma factor [Gammaproteobacteria bacterium]